MAAPPKSASSRLRVESKPPCNCSSVPGTDLTNGPARQCPLAADPSSERIDQQLGADHHRQGLEDKPRGRVPLRGVNPEARMP